MDRRKDESERMKGQQETPKGHQEGTVKVHLRDSMKGHKRSDIHSKRVPKRTTKSDLLTVDALCEKSVQHTVNLKKEEDWKTVCTS